MSNFNSKYTILFRPESIDPGDDQFTGLFNKMLFAYPETKSGWVFDTAEAAYKEAKANDYRPGIDCFVVRVLANKPAAPPHQLTKGE